MITKFGEKFTDLFQKFMPNAFVFALLMTLFTMVAAFFWTGSSPTHILSAWYNGFWSLLEFGMQIVLIIVTGFSIAISPVIRKGINRLCHAINTPFQVYFFVAVVGSLLVLVSFGWIVITCVLARELALRVKGVHYPYLIALVYFTSGSWVFGLSSSIPLLLNTKDNYLIEQGVLQETISTSYSMGSGLNLFMIVLYVIIAASVIIWLSPKKTQGKELNDLLVADGTKDEQTIEEEASSLNLPFENVSDKLNNSSLLQFAIVGLALAYIIYHFLSYGMDLNFNIMIFIFLILGMWVHKSPIRYVIAMKRASSNISGIIFQYPFYAGIMGIMIFTGLGENLSVLMASVATIDTYPFFSFATGGFMNLVIPSAGGEFAVVGPSIINAVQEIGTGLPSEEVKKMVVRASMSVAYGESLSNCLQPFFLLLVFPVMAAGIKIQARDVMGYLMLPFFIFFVIEALLLTFWPI